MSAIYPGTSTPFPTWSPAELADMAAALNPEPVAELAEFFRVLHDVLAEALARLGVAGDLLRRAHEGVAAEAADAHLVRLALVGLDGQGQARQAMAALADHAEYVATTRTRLAEAEELRDPSIVYTLGGPTVVEAVHAPAVARVRDAAVTYETNSNVNYASRFQPYEPPPPLAVDTAAAPGGGAGGFGWTTGGVGAAEPGSGPGAISPGPVAAGAAPPAAAIGPAATGPGPEGPTGVGPTVGGPGPTGAGVIGPAAGGPGPTGAGVIGPSTGGLGPAASGSGPVVGGPALPGTGGPGSGAGGAGYPGTARPPEPGALRRIVPGVPRPPALRGPEIPPGPTGAGRPGHAVSGGSGPDGGARSGSRGDAPAGPGARGDTGTGRGAPGAAGPQASGNRPGVGAFGAPLLGAGAAGRAAEDHRRPPWLVEEDPDAIWFAGLPAYSDPVISAESPNRGGEQR